MADRDRMHPVALLDEMIRRLEDDAAAHPDEAGTMIRAQQIICETVRDAAMEESEQLSRLGRIVLGRGIRGTP